MKKYGKVLQCAGSDTSADLHFGKSDDDKDSDSGELTCGDGKHSHAQFKNDAKGKSDEAHGAIELKAGTKANQHIVSVKPGTKGTDFALVYIRTRGKDTI
jgi:hypothetical protein